MVTDSATTEIPGLRSTGHRLRHARDKGALAEVRSPKADARSGFGRENGRAVLDELTELKSVWVGLG